MKKNRKEYSPKEEEERSTEDPWKRTEPDDDVLFVEAVTDTHVPSDLLSLKVEEAPGVDLFNEAPEPEPELQLVLPVSFEFKPYQVKDLLDISIFKVRLFISPYCLTFLTGRNLTSNVRISHL